jgi:hypothetical protein
MKKLLTLADLDGYSQDELKNHIAQSYEVDRAKLDNVTFLVAFEEVGPWGCDSSSFFLVEIDGELYENHASHCSCYGFEGQWTPESTTVDYLKSDHFSAGYGYTELIKLHIKEIL